MNRTQETPEGYLTILEVAEKLRAEGLKVSTQRVYDLAGDGRLPSEQRGHRIYVAHEAFARWRVEQPDAPTARRHTPRRVTPREDEQAERERRRTVARIGAYTMHARHDSRETSRNGHLAFMRRFEREVDPAGILPERERQRRAESAKKAYFTQLAYRRNAKARETRDAITVAKGARERLQAAS